MQNSHDQLIKLHTTLIDAQQGYEQALKDTNDSHIANLSRSMIALREQHHIELHGALLEAGATPDDSGSFMSTVQRVVIDIRSTVTGLDTGALPSFIRGEEQIIGLYDDALREARGELRTVDILTRQKAALQEKVLDMKSMQTA